MWIFWFCVAWSDLGSASQCGSWVWNALQARGRASSFWMFWQECNQWVFEDVENEVQ